jgi:hypothetical protein
MRTRNLIQSRLPKAEALEVRMESYVGGDKTDFLGKNQPWVWGWRQNHWLWHPVKSLNHLHRALKFLSRYNAQRGKILILFTLDYEHESSTFHLDKELPSNLRWVHKWHSGSYSRVPFHKAMGVMVSPGGNEWLEPKKEGKSRKLPLIGFGNAQENLSYYDYPVPLSFHNEESWQWYANLFPMLNCNNKKQVSFKELADLKAGNKSRSSGQKFKSRFSRQKTTSNKS